MRANGHFCLTYTLSVTDVIDVPLASATGFEWDAVNAAKAQARHHVEPGECEQTCFVVPFIVAVDTRFPLLRPSTTAISVRLPDTLLAKLKILADERDVPYQSLLKVYLADRIATERRQHRRRLKA